MMKHKKWKIEKAQEWQIQKGYKAGANYTTSTACNQLEMFQEETFDPETIAKEFQWAKDIGFKLMRVYLHNLLFTDSKLFQRLDEFLTIAHRYGIEIMFVLFDSCWDPNPVSGPQLPPIPGKHNSRWVQAPGNDILQNEVEFEKLKDYVEGIIGHFRDDHRIFAWDLWNEPDNSNYPHDLISPRLEKVFSWARNANPSQPLTCPIWNNFEVEEFSDFQKLSMDLSDVISFHNYSKEKDFVHCIQRIKHYANERPLICSEYLARTCENFFNPQLQILKSENIYAINWGFVAGKIQTQYSWETLKSPATEDPEIWHHDILKPNGEPYRSAEIEFIKSVLHNHCEDK
jgi:hypothetical protein